MLPVTRDQDQERRARRVPATSCPSCGGTGHRTIPTATIDGATGLLTRMCATCKGAGRRPGFEPPV